MKSRLLPSATAFVLLLGLVSTNLFGQLTNTASVQFLIQSYSGGGDVVDPAFYQSTTMSVPGVSFLSRGMSLFKSRSVAPAGSQL